MTSLAPGYFADPNNPISKFGEHWRRIRLVRSISGVLGWDEQTHLPPAAAEYRADQLAHLATEAHSLLTSDKFGAALRNLEDSLDTLHWMEEDVAEAKRERRRAMALSPKFVESLTRATTAAFHAWQKARAEDRFADFLPHLEEVVRLKQEEAHLVSKAIRPGDNLPLYEALLDEYEPGCSIADVDRIFGEMRRPLAELVRTADAARAPRRPNPLRGHYPAEAQRRLLHRVIEAVGFDTSAGRLDTSTHPFCTRLGPRDTRITTRYDEEDLGDALFSVLHEMGHALYEQGIPPEKWDDPTGEAASLGLHESQSRLWENFIGRGEPFWKWLLPQIEEAFPGAGGGCSFRDWMAAVHDVRRSYIRVDADEVTYNLHVLLRYELERKLIEGRLQPRDLPDAWNALLEELLGLPAPDGNRLGCLQDVHWSGGAFGYFPTYTIGNVYAAQLMEVIKSPGEGANWLEGVERGDFRPILEWLRELVHQRGRAMSAGEIMEEAAGGKMSANALLRHLEAKVETWCL